MKYRPTAGMVVLLVVLSVFTGCASRGSGGLSVDDGALHERLKQASVTVLKDGQIAGAGAFVDETGLVLTAAHVVNRGKRVEVLLPGGEVVAMEVIGRDFGHDMALLKPVEPMHAAYLELADAMPPAGGAIYVIAAPSFYIDTMLPGRIARDRPGFTHLGGLDTYVGSYIIAADTPKGASGGCWIDSRGKLVGVQSAFIGDDAGSLGLAFIGPVDAARELIVAKSDLAASTLDAELVALRSQSPGFIQRFPAGSSGAAVHRIKSGGALDKAGVPREVLITHVGGVAVSDIDQVMGRVREYAPGQLVALRTLSPDQHTVVEYVVELGAVKW